MEREITEDIIRFLEEDMGILGDITSDALLTDEEGKAFIFPKENCVIAGLTEAASIFSHLGIYVEKLVENGEAVDAHKKVMLIKGRARSILIGERLALNIISRMSGIATLTHQLTAIIRKKNPKASLAATRKTTPGFRYYEKKAVELGGGMPHRYGLYDSVIIKDNHLRFMSIREAIRKSKEGVSVPIEVEVESREDAFIAAEENADIIMLDNMPPAKAKLAATEARSIYPNVKIEVSGGITPDNVVNYSFADIISLGWLTHSVKSIDFSLELEKIS